MPENIELTQQDIVDHAHLMTKYVYQDCLLKKKAALAILFSLLTALVIALGLPKSRRIRNAIGISLLIVGPYILGNQFELFQVNTGEAYWQTELLPFATKWNIGLMYLLELIILLFTASIRVGFCFSSLFLTLLYSANYFVHLYRGRPLHLNDLTALRTAARVVGKYDLLPNSAVAMCWCILITFLAIGLQVGGNRKKEKLIRSLARHILCFVLGVILAISSGYKLLYTDMLADIGFSATHGFNYIDYERNGFLVASLMDIQHGRISEPGGYSVEKVEKLLEAAVDHEEIAEAEKEPHIILVMNESFSDLRVLGNLQISEENLPFLIA